MPGCNAEKAVVGLGIRHYVMGYVVKNTTAISIFVGGSSSGGPRFYWQTTSCSTVVVVSFINVFIRGNQCVTSACFIVGFMYVCFGFVHRVACSTR